MLHRHHMLVHALLVSHHLLEDNLTLSKWQMRQLLKCILHLGGQRHALLLELVELLELLELLLLLELLPLLELELLELLELLRRHWHLAVRWQRRSWRLVDRQCGSWLRHARMGRLEGLLLRGSSCGSGANREPAHLE